MSELEFWPEYVGGPLWVDGKSVDLGDLPIPDQLRARLASWNEQYDDAKMTAGSPFIAQGDALLAELRSSLAGRHEVVAWEDWWDT